MNNKELLQAMSELLDKKLDEKLDDKFKIELQPIKEDIRTLKSDVGSLKEDVSSLKEDVDSLKSGQRTLTEEISILKQRFIRLEFHIENVTDKNISILAENYLPAAKRYEKACEQMDIMQDDIKLLKRVVSEHSQILQKLA